MGYLKIQNLYKSQTILNFKRCYAMEKVHGTSAHVGFKDGQVTFYSGGEKHENFVALFDKDALLAKFIELGHSDVTVYGEAYGGKQQGMSHTYGKELKFIAFDISIGGKWLNVPDMDELATSLGFEVVPWREIEVNLDTINALRDAPSEVAARRGCGNDKPREGIVLRPLEEMTVNNDHRIISKHKIDKFGERATPQNVHNIDPNKLQVLADAKAVAVEWVNMMRLSHVLGKLTVDGVAPGIERTRDVISAMIEDVRVEGEGEIVWSKDVEKAIGSRAASLFKELLQEGFR